MSLIKITIPLASMAFAVTAYASGMPQLRIRCSNDSIDPTQAIERIEWSAKCGHVSADEKEDLLFVRSGKKREKPMYPTYATADLSSGWNAPLDRNAPCVVPEGHGIVGFCTSSCYTPDQELLFPEGPTQIKKAKEEKLPLIVTLSQRATLKNLSTQNTKVEAYTEELFNTWHDVLDFEMKSGGKLTVTRNHPLVDSRGRVRAAEQFRKGESLIHFERGEDTISKIEPRRFFGKVYNVTPKATGLKAHVVIAQGYLNGSAHFQNEGISHLNRKILRKNLTKTLTE